VLATGLGLAVGTGPASSQGQEQALAAARQQAEAGDYEGALAAFEQADQGANPLPFEAVMGAAGCAQALGKFSLAEKYAERAVAAADNDRDRARALTLLGSALLGTGQATKRKAKAAADALAEAVELAGSEAKVSRLLLGRTLIRLERQEEGLEQLRRLVADFPDDPLSRAAQSVLDDPRRVTQSILPSFEVATVQGEALSDLSLRGRVVLVDIWATWCLPCREATPRLKELHAQLAEEPFTLLGINVDNDESKLRNYVTEHAMAWPQYWDSASELAGRLGATGYPTFLVVDHEGVIRSVDSGYSEQLLDQITIEIRQALRAAKKAAARSGQ
jgi:thiol-disulfide isomerase/thioredoxin